MDKKKGGKKEEDVVNLPIEALFVGENDHLVIETFINRPLTMEEIGSVKPEAFPLAIQQINYSLVKVPREWSLKPDNKKISQFFDRCTSVVFVINLDTCDQPSSLDPAKNQLTIAFEMLKQFATLNTMHDNTFCVLFLQSSPNLTQAQLSAISEFTAGHGEPNLESLRAHATSIVNTTSSFRIRVRTLAAMLQQARDVVLAAIRDIILHAAVSMI